MRVKMLRGVIRKGKKDLVPGDVLTLPDEEAKALIREGRAEEAKKDEKKDEKK